MCFAIDVQFEVVHRVQSNVWGQWESGLSVDCMVAVDQGSRWRTMAANPAMTKLNIEADDPGP